jgi:hypothetical protein
MFFTDLAKGGLLPELAAKYVPNTIIGSLGEPMRSTI